MATQNEDPKTAAEPVPDAKSEPALTSATNDANATPAAGQPANATESTTAEKTEIEKPAATATDEAAKPEPAAASATTDGAADAAAAGDAAAKSEEPAKPQDSEKKDESAKAEETDKPEVPAKDDVVKPAETTAAAAASAPGVWPEIAEEHPINKLLKLLPDLIKAADGHNEVYGINLDPAGPFHTKLILQKFLRANANDLEKAKSQLGETLKWRGSFKPLAALEDKFDKERYAGLGYVIEVEGVPGSVNKKDVITFNVYGAVKDNKATFGDVEAEKVVLGRKDEPRDRRSSFIAGVSLPTKEPLTAEQVYRGVVRQEFLRWRVALMELGIKKLDLANATQPIPDYGNGPDPYQGIQVHDYLSVSFIRQDPNVKAASKRTIELFSKVYPETLSRKFFVNVPVVMGWMFQAFKLILPKETIKKFTVLSYGNQLAGELGGNVPEVYGGKAGTLEAIGQQTQF